jgi:hypothetical protein
MRGALLLWLLALCSSFCCGAPVRPLAFVAPPSWAAQPGEASDDDSAATDVGLDEDDDDSDDELDLGGGLAPPTPAARPATSLPRFAYALRKSQASTDVPLPPPR